MDNSKNLKRALPKKQRSADFKEFLSDTFNQRLKKNPKYSLRAFARALTMSPSSLSEILSGKRPLTEKMKLKMGWSLGLSKQELSRFFKDSPQVDYSVYPSGPVRELSAVAFEIVSNWYHFAILELSRLEGFQSTHEYISKAVGISKVEAAQGVERLLRVGLLAKDGENNWFYTVPKKSFLTNIIPARTGDANKKMLKQFLSLSEKSIDELDLDTRNHTGMTMTIDVKDLPKAIAKITAFRRGLCTELERTKKANSVYQLHIGFFPLTQRT